MVDPVGPKAIVPGDPRGIAPIGQAARAPIAEGATDRATTGGAAMSLADAVRDMAARPPVDAERVARIRRAIADGTFPISPATIADRMLALKLNWKPDDQA